MKENQCQQLKALIELDTGIEFSYQAQEDIKASARLHTGIDVKGEIFTLLRMIFMYRPDIAEGDSGRYKNSNGTVHCSMNNNSRAEGFEFGGQLFFRARLFTTGQWIVFLIRNGRTLICRVLDRFDFSK